MMRFIILIAFNLLLVFGTSLTRAAQKLEDGEMSASKVEKVESNENLSSEATTDDALSRARSFGQSLFGNIDSEKRPHRGWIWETELEPQDTGWALYIDNDLFALRSNDRDYTGGLSLTLSGARTKDYWFSINDVLQSVDRFSSFDGLHQGNDRQLHSLEVGFTAFTPADISSLDSQVGDRPFASIFYLSNTHESIDFENDTAWVSSFTLGVLGSKLVEELQNNIHKITGSEKPEGWDNQISDGGELTFRYSVAKQSLYHFNYQGSNNLEVSTTWQASLGYITEASFGLATRVGDFDTPWYSFRPQFNDYSEKSASLAGLSNTGDELFFWAGFNLHARVYNAFLQGQFKDTKAAFSSQDLRTFVADAWVGVTKQFVSGWRVSYLIRAQSSEVNKGVADRSAVWGGLILSKGW